MTSPIRRARPRHSALAAALAMALLLAPSASKGHAILADGNPANDWIAGLMNADEEACCGNNDCRPLGQAQLELTLDGGFRVHVAGRRFPVPAASILRDRSPDGRAWMCPRLEAATPFSYRIAGVRCLLLPMMS
ncbi:hypothetical protein [Acuticoccus kandeliae]|uniref:hypothetical protein n=1 Tax=Acuticoccus kandeliae TaxID=2073160 RepID=UPI0014735AA3|nr:hypothetical protein [Acuticoccus kandeliae]